MIILTLLLYLYWLKHKIMAKVSQFELSIIIITRNKARIGRFGRQKKNLLYDQLTKLLYFSNFSTLFLNS